MGMKANAEKVLSGIDRLADAYEKAKGHSMPSCTITKAQYITIVEAIKKEKIQAIPGFNSDKPSYKGVQLNIQ